MISYISNVFNQFGIELDKDKADKLLKYYEMLIETNNKFNLTSITDFDEVIVKHFLDSAAILRFHEYFSGDLIDVGTGAGFPGLVLAILCPELNVTLLESINKKTVFLKDVSSRLSLNNVNVISGRAEDFGNTDSPIRETFDYAVSRAVARLNVLMEYLMPFVKVGGELICFKSNDVTEEIRESENARLTLGGESKDLIEFDLPESSGGRAFYICKKIKPTPPKYPRRAGIPTKKPII